MSDSTPPSGPRARSEYTVARFELKIEGTTSIGPEAAAYIESELRQLLLGFTPYGVNVHSVVLTPRVVQRDSDLEPVLRASLKGGA